MFAVLYWGITQFALPQPMKVVLIVIMALFGLLLIWNFVAGGHTASLSLR